MSGTLNNLFQTNGRGDFQPFPVKIRASHHPFGTLPICIWMAGARCSPPDGFNGGESHGS